MTTADDHLLQLNQQLLDAIANGDWTTYEKMCDPALTAFEPEARGQLVEGMDFHRFYFEKCRFGQANSTTMAAARVRLFGESGDVAIVTYSRLIQRLQADNTPVTQVFEETRVWEKQSGVWKHVHFHRSLPS
jgi:ketosteroid isomerase-like protein